MQGHLYKLVTLLLSGSLRSANMLTFQASIQDSVFFPENLSFQVFSIRTQVVKV